MKKEILSETKKETVRWPIIILTFMMVFLYGLGIYSVIRYFILNPEALIFLGLFLGVLGEMVSENLQTVTYLLAGLIGITLISIPLIIKAMAKFGKEIMTFVIFASPIILIGFGILIVVLLHLAGILVVLLGGVMLLLLMRRKERINLAGRIFELSAEAVATEMGTLVPAILFGAFSIFNVIMGAASASFVMELTSPVQNPVLQGVVVILLELGYAWLLFSSMYLADGTIISIIDDWYRNPTVDKANLKKGVIRVRRVIGPIIQFSFVMALLSTVARTARKKGDEERTSTEGPGIVGVVFLGLITTIASGVVRFITYFTLPAMVIEEKGFKDSVKRSYTLIYRHWIDVLLAHFGIEGTYALFMVLLLALYGTAGGAVGLLLLAPALVATVEPIFVSIFSTLTFVLFGFIPAYFLFRPIKAAYNTILYEYAKDVEADFQLPLRMPQDFREEIRTVITQEQARPSIVRWMKPQFPDEELAS